MGDRTEAGARRPAAGPPRRVVSLVPSLTETAFAVGAGPRLVGRTRYCIHPHEAHRLPSVGGTKDPDVSAVLRLQPDLILANREENREEDVRALAREVPVQVTYPRTVEESAALVAELGQLLGEGERGSRLAADALRAVQAARAEPLPPLRVLYLVWRNPFHAVSADTYVDSVLRTAGAAASPFGGALSRYPALTAEAIRATRPDAILLPSEPFRFGERHRAELLAARLAPVVRLVDGEAFCWWGARTAAGLAYARRVLAEVRAELVRIRDAGGA